MKTLKRITHICFVVPCLFGMPGESSGQASGDRYSKLRHQLLNADSVFLVSHEDTAGFIENPDGSVSPTAPLILNNKLNTSIIKERAVLNKKNLTKLINILTKQTGFPEEAAGCFSPHHSIVMVKNRKYSHIEICFECSRIRVSDDIDYLDDNFDEIRWKNIKSFFKENNFKFKLED